MQACGKAWTGSAEEFEQEHGIKVEVTYGGAAQLLSQIELAGEGDVFIPGGRPIFNKAKEKGFIEDEHFVAYHIPVIGMPKGNPGNITCLKDLARPDVEVALGDAKAVPIGKAANKILEKAGMSSLAGLLIFIRAGSALYRIYVEVGNAVFVVDAKRRYASGIRTNSSVNMHLRPDAIRIIS